MTTKTRLNMEHGFMQIIIKNQMDRDNYDKEMKAKAGKKAAPPSVGTTKAKKPDLHTYTPPKVRSQEARNKSDQSEENAYLFTFEYEDENGELFHLVVNKEDDPGSLARRFGQERNLDSPLVDALSDFLQEQIDKRTLATSS